MRALAASVALAALVATTQPVFADDTAKIMALMKPMLALKSYEATMTSTHGGHQINQDMKIVFPDRFAISGNTTNMIAIGSKTWMKPPGTSQWFPSPVPMGQMIKQFRDPANIQSITKDAHVTYTDAGMGTWKGQAAHILKTTAMVMNHPSQSTVYILGDGLVHHIDVTSSSGTTSIDYSNFNSNFSIQPPA